MNVPRNVVLDLIPVYLAGEASAETKALVEQFAAADAEIAALLSADREIGLPAPAPFHEKSKETLMITKRLIQLRATLFGLALFFSLTPFSVVFTGNTRFWLLRDAPQQAALLFAVAAVAWTAWFLVRRRVNVSGL
ncbi:MAG: hypothetical protein SFV54_28780 [Bryobacteraceae bacterium]|nr:hypothetical protein [Bryobacteraceae bacterium]